eukprot:Nitzschia sp. Nitz4//scaffold71_size96697//67313//68287//NITZ4_004702-RA/size96697-augustus-gene-0.146-mRNA-1//1//CDS//3329557268//5241//frame0
MTLNKQLLLGGILVALAATVADAVNYRRQGRQLHTSTDDWNDDYFTYYDDDTADVVAPTSSSKGKGKGAKSSKTKSPKSSKTKAPKSSKSSTVTDDDTDDATSSTRATIALSGNFFSPAAVATVVPVPSDPDPTSIGTAYTFYNWTSHPDDIDNNIIEMTVGSGDDISTVELWVLLDGYCTRTGTPQNTIEAYCHFSYSVYDPTAGESLGIFVAQGPVVNTDLAFVPCGSLAVTGGTSLFQAATGVVSFCPAILDESLDPPLVESLSIGLDLFEDAQGYLHQAEFSLDEEFVTLSSRV